MSDIRTIRSFAVEREGRPAAGEITISMRCVDDAGATRWWGHVVQLGHFDVSEGAEMPLILETTDTDQNLHEAGDQLAYASGTFAPGERPMTQAETDEFAKPPPLPKG